MKKNRQTFRHICQLTASVFLNGYARGFAGGKIYTGPGKYICVPVLNCYSCPGAAGSCPIGSLQAVLGSRSFCFSFYVFGFLMLFGIVLGRIACGFLCPFGFLQELLYKIPLPKYKVPKKADKILRWIKYFELLSLVILFPLFLTNQFGIAPPYFCKWICPAGTLEGGIPLLLANPSLRSAVGVLFWWKAAVLAVVLTAGVLVERSFCRYLCPLGAFYGLFRRISFHRLELNSDTCIDCGKCESICPMQVEITKSIDSAECIHCGKCQQSCPVGAIESEKVFRFDKKNLVNRRRK